MYVLAALAPAFDLGAYSLDRVLGLTALSSAGAVWTTLGIAAPSGDREPARTETGTGRSGSEYGRVRLQRGSFVKLAAVAAASGVFEPPRYAAAADLPVVKTLSVPTDGTKAILYARKVNLFAKHGLGVDIGSMSNGAAIYAAVLGGAAQFGSGNLFTVFSAFARGVPIRIVAPATMYVSENADTWLIVPEGQPDSHGARSQRQNDRRRIASRQRRVRDARLGEPQRRRRCVDASRRAALRTNSRPHSMPGASTRRSCGHRS